MGPALLSADLLDVVHEGVDTAQRFAIANLQYKHSELRVSWGKGGSNMITNNNYKNS
jgi:hypothetical protein